MFSLIYAWINDWVNNREAGDLRRQHGHYDVIVMKWSDPEEYRVIEYMNPAEILIVTTKSTTRPYVYSTIDTYWTFSHFWNST